MLLLSTCYNVSLFCLILRTLLTPPKYVSGNSWSYLVLLYVYVQISRVIVVGVLYPFLRQFGYGLDWKEAIILTWSGLRGAVALSLSLSLKARFCEPRVHVCVCVYIYILLEEG